MHEQFGRQERISNSQNGRNAEANCSGIRIGLDSAMTSTKLSAFFKMTIQFFCNQNYFKNSKSLN